VPDAREAEPARTAEDQEAGTNGHPESASNGNGNGNDRAHFSGCIGNPAEAGAAVTRG